VRRGNSGQDQNFTGNWHNLSPFFINILARRELQKVEECGAAAVAFIEYVMS